MLCLNQKNSISIFQDFQVKDSFSKVTNAFYFFKGEHGGRVERRLSNGALDMSNALGLISSSTKIYDFHNFCVIFQ